MFFLDGSVRRLPEPARRLNAKREGSSSCKNEGKEQGLADHSFGVCTVCDRPVDTFDQHAPPLFRRMRRGGAQRLGLFEQWIGKCGDQLDQVCLTIDAGLTVSISKDGS